MRSHQIKLLGAAAAALIMGAGLTACNREAEPQTSPELLAPSAAPLKAVNAVAQTYTVSDIQVGQGQVCPLDKEGRLIVFSQKVTGAEDGSKLTVPASSTADSPGQREALEIKVGEQFNAYYSEPIEGGADCGGKHYDDAIHIVHVGIHKPMQSTS